MVSRLADSQVLGEQASHFGHDIGRLFLLTWAEEALRALFAEVQFVRLAIDQIGDVEGSLPIALLTLHDFTQLVVVLCSFGRVFYGDSSCAPRTVKASCTPKS